jgi:hypothetical protein
LVGIYQAEFRLPIDGVNSTPADVTITNKALLEQHNLKQFIDYAIQPSRVICESDNRL